MWLADAPAEHAARSKFIQGDPERMKKWMLGPSAAYRNRLRNKRDVALLFVHLLYDNGKEWALAGSYLETIRYGHNQPLNFLSLIVL
jgi:hypothetical protein